MLTSPRDQKTIDRLQNLLDDTFKARDKLYAAADTLHDADQVTLCRWFGDRLGGYAATLQQVISASGECPAGPESSRDAVAEIGLIQSKAGDDGVLREAEQTEQILVEHYHRAIDRMDDREMVGLLDQQRRELEIAECILRILTRAAQRRR